VRYVGLDTCDGTSIDRQETIELFKTPAGLDLRELGMVVPLTLDGRRFTAKQTFDDGSFIAHDGSFADGALSYTVTAIDAAGPNGPCGLTIAVTGRPRFVLP
jgi:hypothetical protein